MRKLRTSAFDGLSSSGKRRGTDNTKKKKVADEKKLSKALVCNFLIVCQVLICTFSKFFSVVSTSVAVVRLFFKCPPQFFREVGVTKVLHTFPVPWFEFCQLTYLHHGILCLIHHWLASSQSATFCVKFLPSQSSSAITWCFTWQSRLMKQLVSRMNKAKRVLLL